MKKSSVISLSMILGLVVSTPVIANTTSTLEAKRTLINSNNVLTSQSYISNISQTGIAQSNSKLRSSALVTTNNVLTSSYYTSTLSDQGASSIDVSQFKDAFDATVTNQNILSSTYRATVAEAQER